MSIFSYTSTHGMMKKTPLFDHTDDHDDYCNDADADGKDDDLDDQRAMTLIWIRSKMAMIKNRQCPHKKRML